MGCCLSSYKSKNPKTAELRQYQSSSNGKDEQASNAGPEEETVKEVLLETPVKTMIPKRSSEEDTHKPIPPGMIRSTTPATNPHYPLKDPKEIASDQKGIRCYSTTESIPKVDDDEDDEVKQRPPARKLRGPPGGRMVAPPSMARKANVNENGGGRVNEGSARRSKSPVTRMGHSLSDESEQRAMKPSEETPHNDVVLGEEAESLENPVVSLECFIFL